MYFPFRNIIFVIVAVQFTAAVNNNVCPTIDDYETIDTNPKCNYNPDISGNIVRIQITLTYFMHKIIIITDRNGH